MNHKSKQYNLAEINILCRPHIDLHHVGVLMNRGEFKGSGLDKLTNKKHSGVFIPYWYEQKKYSEIEDYIQQETSEFVVFAVKVYDLMANMKNNFVI